MTERLEMSNRVTLSDLPAALPPADITVVETRKKVERDQGKVAALVSLLPERTYAAWPARIGEVFAPARTVRSGRPSFGLRQREDLPEHR